MENTHEYINSIESLEKEFVKIKKSQEEFSKYRQ